MLNIVLMEPEIPPNTGNIARLAVGIGADLHLVEPLGFSLDDKHLRRAGLDYWKHLRWHLYQSMEDFFVQNRNKRMIFLSKRAKICYWEWNYLPDDFLVFGKETEGLPQSLLDKFPDSSLYIPMNNKVRSLNLSNAAAVVAYEAVRQLQFL